MDFFYRCKLFLVLISAVFIVSACSETKNASAPSILGTPQAFAIIDVAYEYEFGADGGDGLLSYSIASGPDWLKIENLNGAKPAFRIYGVPTVGDREKFEEFTTEDIVFVLAVSDGKQTTTQTFELNVGKNVLEFESKTWEPIEGEVSKALNSEDFSEGCKLPSLAAHTIEGKTAYPYPIILVLGAPAETPITLNYSFLTKYDENKPDTDESNALKARPGVDYDNVTGAFTMPAGVTRCAFTVDLFDDNLIEGTEAFHLQFDEIKGGWAVYPGVTAINLVDNEPEVSFDSETTVMSFGDFKDYTLTLSKALDYEVKLNVYVENGVSNQAQVTAADYDIKIAGQVCDARSDITNNTCEIIFPAGETESVFQVLVKDDSLPTASDEVLTIKTTVSRVFKFDPLNIVINEWTNDVVIAETLGAYKAGALVSTDNEGVVTLLQKEVTTTDSDVIVTLNTRNGAKSSFLVSSDPVNNPIDATIASIDGKADEMGGMYYRQSGAHYLVVAATTEGSFPIDITNKNGNNGGKDIILTQFTKSSSGSGYASAWHHQIGTSEDDVVKGVVMDSVLNSYVYGYTYGAFNASLHPDYPVQPHSGNKDAFIAKFNHLGTLLWTRLIGTSADDEISGVTILSNIVYAVGTTGGVLNGTSSGGVDGFLVKLDVAGAVQKTVQFGTDKDDYVTDLSFTRERLWIAGYSQGSVKIASGGIGIDGSAALNSTNPFILNANLEGVISSSVQYGDDVENDISVGLYRVGNEVGMQGATTPGEITTGGNLGGTDAVLTALTSTQKETTILWSKQFGGVDNDEIVDISSFGASKTLVLWKTTTGSDEYYKLTPFSLFGAQLTKQNDSPAIP